MSQIRKIRFLIFQCYRKKNIIAPQYHHPIALMLSRLSNAFRSQMRPTRDRFFSVKNTFGGQTHDNVIPNRKSAFKLGSIFALFVAGILGFSAIDLTVTDDWDTRFKDKFRIPLSSEAQKDRPKVVILGTGWASMSFLRKFHVDEYNVVVVSPRNYFLYTPLLPSTPTGILNFNSVITPVREYAKNLISGRATFLEAQAISVNPKEQKVICRDMDKNLHNLDYDYLVIGVGAEVATFGVPGVKEHAHFLKTLNDSKNIRSTIFNNFEKANIPGKKEDEIQRLLNFVVVGGGPTGIELSANLNDFVNNELKKNYPNIAKYARVKIIEALPRVLSSYNPKLSEYTENHLKKNGVDILYKTSVTKVEPSSLSIKNENGVSQMDYGVLIWATGNTTKGLISDLITKIGVASQNDRRGLIVDDHLLVNGTNNIFAFGDNSISKLPPTAQVANQQGAYLARMFNSNVTGLCDYAKARYKSELPKIEQKKEPKDQSFDNNFSPNLGHPWDKFSKFKFNYKGSMAYVGAGCSLLDYNGFTSTGLFTQYFWRGTYLLKYLSCRNRTKIFSDWVVSDIFGADSSHDSSF